MNLIVIDADALIKELEFVDGMIPEEFSHGSGEIRDREVNVGNEIGKRDEGVLANVFRVGERQ